MYSFIHWDPRQWFQYLACWKWKMNALYRVIKESKENILNKNGKSYARIWRNKWRVFVCVCDAKPPKARWIFVSFNDFITILALNSFNAVAHAMLMLRLKRKRKKESWKCYYFSSNKFLNTLHLSLCIKKKVFFFCFSLFLRFILAVMMQKFAAWALKFFVHLLMMSNER